MTFDSLSSKRLIFIFFFAVFLSCYPQLKKCVFVICSHKFNNLLKLMFPKQPSASTEREMTVKLKSEISEVNFSYLYGITRTVQLLLAGTFGQSIYTALFFRNGQITFFFFFLEFLNNSSNNIWPCSVILTVTSLTWPRSF